MKDLNKEIEFCKQSFEKYWEDFCEAHGNGFDRSLAKLFFANGWGEAKVQAVPECQYGVILTCKQLLDALEFGAPDLKIESNEFSDEQMETELAIIYQENGHSGEGFYSYYVECPDEGSIKLGESESGAEG